MEYQWDPNKARENHRKHGVLFADAVLVFDDPQALTIEDYEHGEERYVTLGTYAQGRILTVIYT